MSEEESVTSVRRTRSGRGVKTPAKASKTPTTRRTRKKVIEVEVSEDDEAQESHDEGKLEGVVEEQKEEPNIEALKSTVKEEMSKISAQINEEKLLQEENDNDDDDKPLIEIAHPADASNGDENEVKLDDSTENAILMEVDSDNEVLDAKKSEDSSEEEKVEEAMETTEEVKEEVENIPEEVKEEIENLPEEVKEEIENLPEKVKEEIENLPEEVKEEIENLTEEVKEEIEKVPEEVKEEIENLTEEVKEEVEKVPEEVKEEIKNLPEEDKKETEKLSNETKEVKEKVESETEEVDEIMEESAEEPEKEELVDNNGKSMEDLEKKLLDEEKSQEKSEEPMETNDGDAKKAEAKPESENGLDNLSDADMTECIEETKQNGDPDAENISEDELPEVPVAKVPETEEVSDEELPGPKRAELPADTEVVSEDELPTATTKKEGTNKRKLDENDYDPGSPTSENEAPAKKPAVEKSPEKEKEEKPVKPKKLPELDKYWKAVNDDPTDFTGWTYLLQYVDQENDMEAAREAYDAFLSHYPYCYGYWRKYADYEKRKGNKKKCEEVFERGLKSIPLSVDLWIHYLTYAKTTKADDEEYVRSQFERALTACGLEFRSDRLWDSYIKWETEAKRLQHVTAIYDRLLATPTQGYTSHFDNFQEHISSNSPNKVVEVDEFLALRKEVRHILKHDNPEPNPDSDAPPGDDDSAKLISSDEETKSIRERIVSIRRKIHKNTVNAVTARWNFEEGIKRPYFHVKPLERCQLKNWQDYLDYEMEQGDKTRAIVLFERCLIACALYEEFWLKFVHYLESLKDSELQPKIRDVYERACTIHHLKKPNLHLQWAMFEESVANYNRAAEILVNLEKSVPNVLQVAYRRINLERRRVDHEKCMQLFEHYINNSKNKMISSNISIKYSRFCLKVLKDMEKAQETLKTAIAKDPNNPRLYLQLIDLTLQKEEVTENEVIELIDSFLDKDSTDADQKVLFAQRKLEYLEDFGAEIQSVQLAYEQYQKLIKLSKENSKKKESKSADSTVSTKKEKGAAQTSTTSSYGYNYGTSSNTASYPYSGSQQGQYNYPQYGQGDQYQYQNWQYPQGGYGNYNQWGSYSGGYGY